MGEQNKLHHAFQDLLIGSELIYDHRDYERSIRNLRGSPWDFGGNTQASKILKVGSLCDLATSLISPLTCTLSVGIFIVEMLSKGGRSQNGCV